MRVGWTASADADGKLAPHRRVMRRYRLVAAGAGPPGSDHR
jgi:hypothetical protein